ncbi:hypothetical protein B0H10DRAFT_55529 [Mycena sp. CBHHK59/15]|nr:hypothetical protein B0H10DRAFT_55529 [Mycena sp. CBHHK59/15]
MRRERTSGLPATSFVLALMFPRYAEILNNCSRYDEKKIYTAGKQFGTVKYFIKVHRHYDHRLASDMISVLSRRLIVRCTSHLLGSSVGYQVGVEILGLRIKYLRRVFLTNLSQDDSQIDEYDINTP